MPTIPAFRWWQFYLTIGALLKLCTISFFFGYRNAVYEGRQKHSKKNDNTTTARARARATTTAAAVHDRITVTSSTNDDAAAAADAATNNCKLPLWEELPTTLRRKIYAQLKERLASEAKHTRRDQQSTSKTKTSRHRTDRNEVDQIIFPNTVRGYAVGALRVSREEMFSTYDFGVPIKNISGVDDMEAMIIYNTDAALPSSTAELRNLAIYGEKNSGVIAKASVSEAMESCDTLNVIFTAMNYDTHCHVLIGDFESYHINRWMRIPMDDRKKDRKTSLKLNSSLPLRHVGRIITKDGVDTFDLPTVWDDYHRRKKGFVLQHFERMQIFLENVDRILDDLRNLLAHHNVVRDNTVVVLTVNAGQSELLTNFVCAARSRGLDIGNVLVFPTDEQTHKLAQDLGVASYFDEKNLGGLPSEEAVMYGDRTFASMMFAKVLCVLYMSLLGHDVLFQDVDIVWYKDPLAYFHDKSNTALQEFDILFQHDGSGQPRYSPFSANSGFYYVRANKKTAYLFTSMLYHGAVIRKSKSHQQVLVQLLNEHSSMFGLKVKVFDSVQTDMFPGGYHYHQDWDTMRAIMSGESNAYIFHMSWTENKVNKILFFRQIGEWYVHDECISDDVSNLIDADKMVGGSLIEQCCSIEPILSCHFRDKPSKVPCLDSPKLDPKHGKSFWTL